MIPPLHYAEFSGLFVPRSPHEKEGKAVLNSAG